MRVAIFGATGRLGKEVLQHARTQGFSVTAHARKLTHKSEPGVEWRTGDAENVIRDADAVLVLFGHRSPSAAPFCAAETARILSAMRRHNLDRILCVTGAMVGDYPRNRTWVFQQLTAFVQRRYRVTMEDRAQQETLIRNCEMKWTLLKPPRLTDSQATDEVIAGSDVRVGILCRIARGDLARFLLDEVQEERFAGTSVFVKGMR